MEANTSLEVLVAIVSLTLFVFLVIGIVVLVKVSQLVDQLKRVTDKAESLMEQAESLGSFFQKSSGPVMIGKLLANMWHHVTAKRGKDDGEKD